MISPSLFGFSHQTIDNYVHILLLSIRVERITKGTDPSAYIRGLEEGPAKHKTPTQLSPWPAARFQVSQA